MSLGRWKTRTLGCVCDKKLMLELLGTIPKSCIIIGLPGVASWEIVLEYTWMGWIDTPLQCDGHKMDIRWHLLGTCQIVGIELPSNRAKILQPACLPLMGDKLLAVSFLYIIPVYCETLRKEL